MAEVKWIKITTDVFDDEKILLIESLPEADSIIVIWFKLLCLAGKQNNSGVFIMGNSIPYTDKMLATIFRRKEATVQLALQTFEQFGMIEMIDGVITIPNWGKHQNLDQLENKKEYMRNYMRDYREKQKALTCKTNSKTNVRQAEEEIDIEEEKEEEREKENIISVSKDTECQTQGVRQVIEAWNTLSCYGIKPVSKITSSSKRYKCINARINEYGIAEVLNAIDKVKESDYLKGRNKHGWTITFDWFCLPNNFPKVLDGNYDNRSGSKQPMNKKAQELDEFYQMASDWANGG